MNLLKKELNSNCNMKRLLSLIHLKGFYLLALTVIAAAGLLCVFQNGRQESVPAAGIYFLSAYTLAALCIAAVRTGKRLYRRALRWVSSTGWSGIRNYG